MLFGLGLFCGRVEGSQTSRGHTGGGVGAGEGGGSARTVTDKDERKTNRPPPSLLPPPPPLEACPLKIDKVDFCVALPASTPMWLLHSPVSAAIRSRPFAAPGGCHTTFSNTIGRYNISAWGTSISSRAHELTCKEASCSLVDVYWRQSHRGICTGGGDTEPLHTSVPIGCQDNQTHLLRQPVKLLFWNVFACLPSLIARIGNFEVLPRRCPIGVCRLRVKKKKMLGEGLNSF